MAKEEVEFEKTVEVDEAVAYLERVAAGLRGGKVLVEEGNSSVSLEVKGPITMEIEADFDSDKQKCSFEVKLEWRLGEAQPRERGERRER